MGLGPELIVNGNFNGNADNWDFDSGWSYNTNKMLYGGVDGNQILRQIISAFEGMAYQVSFNIESDFTDFGITNISLGGSDSSQKIAGTGQHVFQILADDLVFNGLTVQAFGSNPFTITNISVKLIIPIQYTGNSYLAFADPSGNVQNLNISTSDNNTPIYFELQTQEMNFGDRGHLKKIGDKMAILTNQGVDSVLECDTGNGFKSIPMSLSNRINFNKDIDLEGYYFTWKWSGSSSTVSPVFEGFYLESISDLGITKS